MIANRSLFGIACRAAAFSFLLAGSALLIEAQQPTAVTSAAPAPLFAASASTPLDLTGTSSSSSSSSSDATPSYAKLDFDSAALGASQPPPRRTYGRPTYHGGNTNPDGSDKYFALIGFGTGLPIGITHKYETLSWGVQAGAGRNFSKTVGVDAEFNYDHFGLQGKTLSNEEYAYNYYCNSSQCTLITGLDGNNHVWSFTLNPTFTLPTQGPLGVYAGFGGGYYHKVTNFTVKGTGYYYDPYYGYIPYTANEVIDHYTSNAFGADGAVGLTWKFSKFSNEQFYVEGRYVVVLNEHRAGVTAQNVATFGATYPGSNYYPANSNRTTYIPIKVGIRF